jgi:hypothetical protein
MNFLSDLGGKEHRVVIVTGNDRRYWYFGLVELEPSASLHDFESVFRDHLWDYGRTLSLDKLHPVTLQPRHYIDTDYFGTIDLPSPWRTLEDAWGPPWIGNIGFFISEPNHEGHARVLVPELPTVDRVLRLRSPPFSFKDVLPSGIRHYTDRSGRSAYEIRKGRRSLILEEMEGDRLEVRFSEDLKKLALYINQVLSKRKISDG